MKENIVELQAGLVPFPEDIFVPEQSWLYNYLLPLITIDLAMLSDELKGTELHLVNPIESYFGLLGQETKEFHTDFTATNWIAFELTKENQYRFLAPENYFMSAPVHQHR